MGAKTGVKEQYIFESHKKIIILEEILLTKEIWAFFHLKKYLRSVERMIWRILRGFQEPMETSELHRVFLEPMEPSELHKVFLEPRWDEVKGIMPDWSNLEPTIFFLSYCTLFYL